MVTDRGEFGGHVRNALKGFYKASALQGSPLIELLGLVERAGGDAVQALRQVIREEIAKLKPEPSVPYGAPQWLGYRILWTRYINARSQSATCDELGISSSTYYRYLHEARDVLIESLWRQAQSLSARQNPQSAPALQPSADMAQEAARLAATSRRKRVNLRRLVAEVQDTIQPLAEQAQRAIEAHLPNPAPCLYADPALVNQIMLSVLSETLFIAEGDTLHLSVSVRADRSEWRFGPLQPEPLEAVGGAESRNLALARALVGAYGGEVWVEQGQFGAALGLSLASAQAPLVLVIDDDPDMPRLYGVHLQSLGIMLKTATTSEQLADQLAEAVPDLILLDILMPQWDGWRILRELKADQRTAHIPVVICSVLTQPRLALALGAERVLQKPISQAALTETARELLPL